MNKELKSLFQEYFDQPVKKNNKLPIHGSNRVRYRLTGETHTAIGVENSDHAENVAFIAFARHFHRHGLLVPEIYAEKLDSNIYLEEDLGKQTLFDMLTEKRQDSATFPQEMEALYAKVVGILPDFQIKASEALNYDVCYPRHSFDRQSIMWDLNYFKYYFLKLAQISFDEQKLEDDFNRFADFLLQPERDFFLYRDFQSRNVMIRDGEPYFIDFQGGRRGALQYDIASMLYDSKANLPFDVRERLLNVYLDAAQAQISLDRNEFLRYYYGYVLVRLMQAMGAYGFRGFYERKTHFLQSVPFAIRNLEYVLKTDSLPRELPTLTDCLQKITRSTKLRELGNSKLPLTIHLQSFSYKRGLPKDETGHGGGFIFDCRVLPNPGRLDEYKHLTGNDKAVIAFLEHRQEIHSFLTRVRDLISQVVENYSARNFSHLSISFGCTGGQHRSVYCANQLNKFLLEKYQVKVELSHREEESWPVSEL